MQQSENTSLPFHESILELLRSCSDHGIPELFRLIKRTKIPSGHDSILEHLRVYHEGHPLVESVQKHVLQQKLLHDKSGSVQNTKPINLKPGHFGEMIEDTPRHHPYF
ncbi:MAG TPA: hypothetical protein PKA60_00455 [Candidatus Paceibacterota bacterium]|nr:hypothetical protein [Candidatus Paceibacterota bacterium]